MICETIDLYAYFNIARGGATGGYLSSYARTPLKEIKPKFRPAMLVIPGGGYEFLSGREGEPVALAFLNAGYSSFVLSYSVNTPYPAPLYEAIMAVAYIKENAEKYCVNRDKVAAVGFSAGGHLAGLLATATEEERKAVLKDRPDLSRIDGVILSYPVVTMGEFAHDGSRRVISDNGAIAYDKLSVEKRVKKDSAPAFIWHTAEDTCVAVENSLLLAGSYRTAGVPLSLHIFEKGWHGLSLCNAEVNDQRDGDVALSNVGIWLNLSLDWLASRGFKVNTEK